MIQLSSDLIDIPTCVSSGAVEKVILILLIIQFWSLSLFCCVGIEDMISGCWNCNWRYWSYLGRLSTWIRFLLGWSWCFAILHRFVWICDFLSLILTKRFAHHVRFCSHHFYLLIFWCLQLQQMVPFRVFISLLLVLLRLPLIYLNIDFLINVILSLNHLFVYNLRGFRLVVSL